MLTNHNLIMDFKLRSNPFSLPKSLDCPIDCESPNVPGSLSYDDLSEKYYSLKQKYSKLYKEHNLILKALENDEQDSKKLENQASLLKSLELKVLWQQKEIAELRKTNENLHASIDKTRPEPINSPKRSHSYSINETSLVDLKLKSLGLSADASMLNFLIHRLMMHQDIDRKELLQCRFALQRIESRFDDLSNKLQSNSE